MGSAFRLPHLRGLTIEQARGRKPKAGQDDGGGEGDGSDGGQLDLNLVASE